MLDWYLTRTGDGLTHRGQKLPEGKKVRLTDNQVKQINKKEERVAKCDAPTGPEEVAIFAEWHDWQKNITAPQSVSSDRRLNDDLRLSESRDEAGTALIEEGVTTELEEKNKKASRDKNQTKNKGQVNPSDKK